jgi:hypothetical protein
MQQGPLATVVAILTVVAVVGTLLNWKSREEERARNQHTISSLKKHNQILRVDVLKRRMEKYATCYVLAHYVDAAPQSFTKHMLVQMFNDILCEKEVGYSLHVLGEEAFRDGWIADPECYY